MAKSSSSVADGKPTSSTAPRRSPRTLAGAAPPDAARNKTLALYETALKLAHAGKYEKAHAAFNEMLASAPPELGNSIRTQIARCLTHLDKGTTKFESHEERYDYAISLLNNGDYEEARAHFEKILGENAHADYAFYGLALLASLTDNAMDCIEHLREAIRLNPQNRYQARGDSDFHNVADDPRFTELLYPEA